MITYEEKLEDPKWMVKRRRIIERDNGICCDCGLTSENLQVHHLVYKGEPWDVDDKYLITLCERCHHYRHHLRGRICETLSIGQIMRGECHG